MPEILQRPKAMVYKAFRNRRRVLKVLVMLDREVTLDQQKSYSVHVKLTIKIQRMSGNLSNVTV